MRFHQLQRGLRTRLAELLAPPSTDGIVEAYYPQQPSCQIPSLHFLFARFLGEREHGLFVEVGAYDGVFVSNTWGLAERNWTGLMAEPVPHLAAACRTNHKHHPGVTVVETAVGRAESSEVTLQLAGTLTTANPEAYREFESVEWAAPTLTQEKIVVPSQSLDRLLRENGVPEGFDVLVVDVEGFEAEVFAGFDLEGWCPKMLIVELLDTHPDLSLTADSDAALGERVLAAGYRVAYKDMINTVFVRADIWHSAFAQTAP